jgi:hypothetical protein
VASFSVFWREAGAENGIDTEHGEKLTETSWTTTSSGSPFPVRASRSSKT